MNPTSLTNERLCALAQKGDGAARELLVEKNMGFIVQTADIVYRSLSLEGSDLNIDVDDLVQEGSIGLLRAVDGFDPARKLRFLTYAAPAIKNAMLDLVHTAQMSFEYRMATAKVQDGVEGLGLERVHLDEILPGDERLLRIEAIADPYALSPEEAFIKAETLWELYAALNKLEPREQTYLLYRFGFTDDIRAHTDRRGDTFSSEREPDKAAGGTVAGYASEVDAVRQRNVAAAGRGLYIPLLPFPSSRILLLKNPAFVLYLTSQNPPVLLPLKSVCQPLSVRTADGEASPFPVSAGSKGITH